MSAIAYYLESEGLQTTGISLVRENTEALKPPRFLWTSFPLGRPLGRPGDPAFQRRVILAALALLERASGPVLEDYPEDAGVAEDSAFASNLAGPSCPISFPKATRSSDSWTGRLADELQLIRPWYDLAVRRRGRTTFGVAREPIEACLRRVGEAADAHSVETDGLKALKYAIEDAKAYWLEAMTAQPGSLEADALYRLLWRETDLGRAIVAIQAACSESDNPMLQGFARAVAPRSATED